MPLLMCPNCNGSMQEIKRSDVAFDMCPSCRGVWLDRGELEKIIAATRAEFDAQAQQHSAPIQQRSPPQQHPQHGYGEYGERGEHGERGEYSRDGRRRRGFDLFDIFD